MKLKESNITYMNSLALGCKIWYTKHKNMYVTDFDMVNHESLKEKNMLMIFIIGKGYAYINKTLLNNEERFNVIDEYFKLFNE